MTTDHDSIASGALLVCGGLVGYGVARWLRSRPAQATPMPPTLELAAAPVASTPPPVVDTPPTPPAGSLPRTFDAIFERHRGAIPIEYLRALAKRESDMKPGERSGPAWGLMQIVEVVRTDYNQAHGTRHSRADLLDPDVNVAMCCWVLRFIIASYQRNHPRIPNLRADWSNPRFVELLTFGWNAGFSERAGVGRVVSYLEKLGAADVDIDQVHAHARLAGASRHLSNEAKVRWCKSVVILYQRERAGATDRTVHHAV